MISFSTLKFVSIVIIFVSLLQMKEAKKLKEFLEDYDDERDDPKYYKLVHEWGGFTLFDPVKPLSNHAFFASYWIANRPVVHQSYSG